MEIIFLLFTMTIVMIHGQSVSEADLLVANYDNAQHKLKAFAIRQPLVLHCNVTKEGDYDLIWEKNGVKVSKLDELEDRYVIYDDEHTFIIRKTEESDAGLYSCRLEDTNAKKEFHVLAEVAVRTPSNIIVPESEDLLIECEVVGSQAKIHWEIRNDTTVNSSNERYTLKYNANGIKNGVLLLKNATLEDRGDFKCVATNILTELNISVEASDVTFVRVKDHLAALWPALGILVEVVIIGIVTIVARNADKNMVFE